jgi:hypothetical protein
MLGQGIPWHIILPFFVLGLIFALYKEHQARSARQAKKTDP